VSRAHLIVRPIRLVFLAAASIVGKFHPISYAMSQCFDAWREVRDGIFAEGAVFIT
jgi:hypothetical protein